MARCSLMPEEPKKTKGRGKGGAKARGTAVDEDDVDIGALEEGEAPPVQVRREAGDEPSRWGGGGVTCGSTYAGALTPHYSFHTFSHSGGLLGGERGGGGRLCGRRCAAQEAG